MANELIERVATALRDGLIRHGHQFRQQAASGVRLSPEAQQAQGDRMACELAGWAIEAMREPTQPMLDAGAFVSPSAMDRSQIGFIAAGQAWDAMINAALAVEPEPGETVLLTPANDG